VIVSPATLGESDLSNAWRILESLASEGDLLFKEMRKACDRTDAALAELCRYHTVIYNL
jgi:hypothetical protein